MIRRIRRKKFLIHSNWNAAFNSICQEDNFYRRRGLLELLKTYEKQDRILETNGEWSDTKAECPIIGSYLNTSKLLFKRGKEEKVNNNKQNDQNFAIKKQV